MTQTKWFEDPYERIKVVLEFTNERDSSLHVNINPEEYFYPYLSVRPDDIYDESHGLSYKHFQREKTIIKMLGENAYKDIFRQRVVYGLYNYLRATQAEADLEFKEGKSLEQKVAENEEIIFDLLKKKGPGIFRYSAVIEKIQNWCDEKDNAKIEKLTVALKEYGKSIYGAIPFSSYEQRYYFVLKYRTILNNLRALKKDITAKRKEIKDYRRLEKEIIEKWANKSASPKLQNKSWFELLLDRAKKEKAKDNTDFFTFIKTNSPKELAMEIFYMVEPLSLWTIDKILRNQQAIMKTMSMSWDDEGHGFWGTLDLH